MLEQLFSSKARVDILRLFLFSSPKRFYQRQIEILTDQPIRAVQRETEKLVSMGLLEKESEGNRAYYRVNKNSPIFAELKSIFFKYVGIAEVLRSSLNSKEKIRTAFIYGSYANGNETPSSDIDLFVIGTLTSRELSGILSKPKKQLGHEINYSVIPEAEFRQKVKNKDHFLTSLMKEKKIFIIGTQNELKAIIRSE
ncbi:MAG: nucleotidyltransferase domain-containing protein [Elusimicrobia bacterium]|nr:nucleotidyltransferase domain-containing protein [Candidatus Liberimonas magnetica]